MEKRIEARSTAVLYWVVYGLFRIRKVAVVVLFQAAKLTYLGQLAAATQVGRTPVHRTLNPKPSNFRSQLMSQHDISCFRVSPSNVVADPAPALDQPTGGAARAVKLEVFDENVCVAKSACLLYLATYIPTYIHA